MSDINEALNSKDMNHYKEIEDYLLVEFSTDALASDMRSRPPPINEDSAAITTKYEKFKERADAEIPVFPDFVEVYKLTAQKYSSMISENPIYVGVDMKRLREDFKEYKKVIEAERKPVDEMTHSELVESLLRNRPGYALLNNKEMKDVLEVHMKALKLRETGKLKGSPYEHHFCSADEIDKLYPRFKGYYR